MNEYSAIRFYINGLSELDNLQKQSALDKYIQREVSDNNEDLRSTYSQLSPYWVNHSAKEIFSEITKYSDLILLNSLPLEYYDDLVALMLAHANPNFRQRAKWQAHKIAVACCGKTHLYLDMGYKDRSTITELFHSNFPQLAMKNPSNKMRWKKFLYRQFCLDSGLPICPTASCSDCPSHRECYTAAI